MTGRIVAIYGNMVVAETTGQVVQNSVGHCCRQDGARLLSEVIRIRGRLADLQVFEETRGLRVGDPVEFSREMLSVKLGPGLLGQIFDGLQNPLPKLAEQAGFFLKPRHVHRPPRQRPEVGVHPRGRGRRHGQRRRHAGVGPGRHLRAPDHGAVRPCRGTGKVDRSPPPATTRSATRSPCSSDGQGATQKVTMVQTWPVKLP